MKHNPGFLALVTQARKLIRECSAADVQARLERGERLVLIDVREESEFAAGHARGARHIGRGILERDVETHYPDKDTELVLYCGGGYRSALSALELGKMGYRNVRSMEGGFRAWQEGGYPIEK